MNQTVLIDCTQFQQTVCNVFVAGKKQAVNLYQREQLTAGAFFKGPAVVAQNDTTTCIPDGISGEVDTHGNLVLTIEKKQ